VASPAARAATEKDDAGSTAAPAPLSLSASEPAVAAEAHVEIRFPISEQRLTAQKADKYPIRLKVEGLPEGAGVELALNDHRPRRVDQLPAPITLPALLPADVALTPGAHWLTATAVQSDGRLLRRTGEGSTQPHAAVRVWVGERGERTEPAPRVVLFSPRGTYNGEQRADAIVIDFLPLFAGFGREISAAKVEVHGQDSSGTLRLERWRPVAFKHAASGDYAVRVTLLGQGDRELAHAERTITVNRDLTAPP
jgi:hypothetical protein